MSTDLAVVLVLPAAMETWRRAVSQASGGASRPGRRHAHATPSGPRAGPPHARRVVARGPHRAGLADADVHDLRPGPFAGGVGAGFLTNTPDGVEFALNGHVGDVSLRGFAIGLLGQSTLGGNDQVVGRSVQTTYWWDIPV
jgi:hypothetical protein